MKKTLVRNALVALIAVATSVGVVTLLPTNAAHAEVDPTSEAFIATQERLIEASREARLLTSNFEGFAMSELEVTESTLLLHWKSPAAALQERVAEIASKHEVSIKFVPSDYTEQELKAAVNQAASVAGVTSASFDSGDGINLTVAKATNSLALNSRRGALSIRGVPVLTVGVDAAAPAAATRDNDRPGFSGGAGYRYVLDNITNTYQPNCSTAFGARDSGGGRFLISAAHCFTANNQEARTQDGYLIGRTERLDRRTDSVLIRVSSADGRAWNGYKNNPTQAARVSSQTTFTEKGQYVCNIGARSGAVCGIRVTNHYYVYELEGYEGIDIVGYTAIQTGAGHAIARGDSGGPVIQNVAHLDVRAAGLVSGGVKSSRMTCPFNVGSTLCWKEIIYVGIFEVQYGGLSLSYS